MVRAEGGRAGRAEHGYARILPWAVKDVATRAGRRPARGPRAHAAGTAARGLPHELALELTVAVGRSLRLTLAVRNVDSAPARVEAALHSYFAVSDVRQIVVSGLEGVGYVDKTAGMARKPGAGPDHDHRGDRPCLPRDADERHDRGPRLAPADRRVEVGLGHDGRLEPLDRESAGDAGLRRRRVDRR